MSSIYGHISQVDHLVHFTNNVRHNIGRIQFTKIKLINKSQIMKGPLKVDNPIISKLDRYKMWAIII